MASKELTEKIETRVRATEDRIISLLNRRLEYMDEELKIRSDLSFKKSNPDFEYENDPVYLEHLKKGFELSIEEEKISIQKTIDGIYNERDNRDELNKMKEEN